MGVSVSLTEQVVDELSAVTETARRRRIAAVAAILRMSGQMRVSRTGLVIETEIASESVARMLRREVAELFPAARVSARSCSGRTSGYLVRIDAAETVAAQTGLIDGRDRTVIGLPQTVVGGDPGQIGAAWRGAIMAAGRVHGPGRTSGIEVRCPTPEAAYALASCARRIGVGPLVRTARGVNRVIVTAEGDIDVLLARVGADSSRAGWAGLMSRYRTAMSSQARTNMDIGNAARRLRAAESAAVKAKWALGVLGDDAPEHLAATGRLRIDHPEASLEDLGQLSEPAITKDAVSGRLRRLYEAALEYEQSQAETGEDFDPETETEPEPDTEPDTEPGTEPGTDPCEDAAADPSELLAGADR